MSEAEPRGPDLDAGVVRLLAAAGAFGGLLWAAIPIVAAVTFYGLEAGLTGLGSLARLGSLFLLAPVAVVCLLAGAVGLGWRFRASSLRLGRVGSGTMVLGFVLLLPASVVPSGTWPSRLGSLVPLVFFAGLAVIAAGSLGFGVAARRSGALPDWLAIGFAAAMPVGFVVGAAVAVAVAGNLALVLGLTVPYGLAWAVLGGHLAWNDL